MWQALFLQCTSSFAYSNLLVNARFELAKNSLFVSPELKLASLGKNTYRRTAPIGNSERARVARLLVGTRRFARWVAVQPRWTFGGIIWHPGLRVIAMDAFSDSLRMFVFC
jgi:hypothetical protein